MKEPDDFDGSFEGTRLRQILAGLELNHTERLRWLEERMSELMRLRGKAGASELPPTCHTEITPTSDSRMAAQLGLASGATGNSLGRKH